eukprot:scaffold4201_cov178-Amphora_coffeaeformis.AAC.18
MRSSRREDFSHTDEYTKFAYALAAMSEWMGKILSFDDAVRLFDDGGMMAMERSCGVLSAVRFRSKDR